MIKINDKSQCCGCSACCSACGTAAIHMQSDAEGFIYPVADGNKCVGCSRCDNVCPIGVENTDSTRITTAYIAYANDDAIRAESSSGGIFSLLAEKIIQSGGTVFGAAYDENWNVRHISVDNIENIGQLRGSKYTQSELGNSYIETKRLLQENKTVLFSGTQCQISGLKSFLSEDYDNLYTVDVLCHGVPSPKLWKIYLNEQARNNGAEIADIFMREKSRGWKDYSVHITFDNGSDYLQQHHADNYMRLFLSNICLRPSCHKCRFKSIDRDSDITIGDCWGVDKNFPDMYDNYGTSVVLTHSDKGKELFLDCRDNMLIKEADADMAVSPNADSRKSVAEHAKRNKFFIRLNEGYSTDELVKLINPSIKTRIISRLKRLIRKIVK